LGLSIKRFASLHEMTVMSALANEPLMTNKANKHVENTDFIDESPLRFSGHLADVNCGSLGYSLECFSHLGSF
jgi:hypothetical protein